MREKDASQILSPYLRKVKNCEKVAPLLDLKGSSRVPWFCRTLHLLKSPDSNNGASRPARTLPGLAPRLRQVPTLGFPEVLPNCFARPVDSS